ncbi:MerR family DNA-binding transcriptional regulator [Rhodobacteraceae bacterium]|nr:MerR family DNA-binding transcriptional regulator [Paracoccaceae bacterium]
MTGNFMTIREMCDHFEVTPRTLRFYEQKELLFPERTGNRRLYTKRDRARLKLILRGKRFGFTLEDIRQLLDLYDPVQNNLPQIRRACMLGQERLADLEQRRVELDEVIDDLKEQLKTGEQMITSLLATAAE